MPICPRAIRAAACCDQERLFDRAIRDLTAAALVGWRERFRNRLESIGARYPPRVLVDLYDLADMLSAVVDGGIILSHTIHDKHALPRQVMLYREFIRTLFRDPGS